MSCNFENTSENAGIFILTDGVLGDDTALSFEQTRKAMYWILYHTLNIGSIKELTLVINSKGGDLSLALALSNAIQASLLPVNTIGIGDSSSAALMILMSGTGTRSVTPGTSMLTHFASWEPSASSPRSAISQAQEMERSKKVILDYYKKYTKLSEKVILKELLTGDDIYISHEEAIKYNIIDFVDSSNKWIKKHNGNR